MVKRIRKKVIILIFFLTGAMGLSASENAYMFINAGVNSPVRQTIVGVHAGLGGYSLIKNFLLIGGYGEYFYSNGIHLGNGLGILGFGHVFNRKLAINIEGVLGLGGGSINRRGGAVYLYGANIFLGLKIFPRVYPGLVAGYRSIHGLFIFNDTEFPNDYLSIALRLSFGP